WGTLGGAPGEFNAPIGIASDPLGNIYVTDYFNHRVQKFSSGGAFISQFGSNGSADGLFANPNGIACANDTVFVADQGNNRIQKFDSNGNFVQKWGAGGTGNGQFSGLAGLAVDATGANVYTTETVTNRVQNFSRTGAFILKWGTPG